MQVILRVYRIDTPGALEIINKALNKSFKGIWHTSLEIFGKEIFFANEIITTLPGSSVRHILHDTHHMGETSITEDEFELFLMTLNEKFGKNSYNLLRNNCNHFTNTCVKFLVDKQIPPYILEVHEAVLENELVSKMVEMFFNNVNGQ